MVEARRLPLLPLFLVIFVLIVPSIFAELIAPHDPEVGVLPDRLIPPSWSDPEVLRFQGGLNSVSLKSSWTGSLCPRLS